MSNAAYVAETKRKISLRPSQKAVKRAALALLLALGVATAADFGYGYLTTGRYLEPPHATLAPGPRGASPSATALREGRAIHSTDIANDPAMAPWRDNAGRVGRTGWA